MTITCSTDVANVLTYTRLVSRAVFVVCLSSLVQPACLLEHGAHGKRSGRFSCLWKSFYKSGQNLAVNLSDNVNDVGSILFSTVQTELIENQLSMKSQNSVNTVSTRACPLSRKDMTSISSRPCFLSLEGSDIHLKTNVFRKTGHEMLCLRTRLSF